MNSGRHLLVDGANILHAWRELRELVKRDRDAARARLVSSLAPIHDAGTARVTIVFDGRGDELVVEHPAELKSFAVIHTPSNLTADDVIEQMVANSAEAATCIVATDDQAERETVMAAGATAIRSDELEAWAQRASSRQTDAVKALRTANARAWKAP
ncbi:MAG TPA: NYN domain-containing protein [Opitutus sp.]|nr:NYN domain-containing protein [Opitutus sp.]